MAQLSLHSPVGDLTLSAENDCIVALDWGWSPLATASAFLHSAKQQLDDYFDGKSKNFTLPLKCSGTEFQNRVWQELILISYGKTMTYSDIAIILNSHPRAVASACSRNPIPIIIPCHRVVAKNGALSGYSGGEGIKTKKFLFEFERLTPGI